MTWARSKPLNRTGFKSREPMQPGLVAAPKKEPKPPKGPRQKRCAICKLSFVPLQPMQKVCCTACAILHAESIRKAQERKTDRERRTALKTRQDWLREAQAAFNAFIRERDKAEPCISCGRFHQGKWNAGHFRSVGAQASLRFDENNVHKQCEPCNSHLSGNVVEYRLRLIQKIGQIAVDWLEVDHPPVKYTIEDAQQIKARYKLKLKELQNAE